MKNSQKGFAPIVILIIIAVAAIGGGAYYVKQKKTPEPKQNQPEQTVNATSTKDVAVDIKATTTTVIDTKATSTSPNKKPTIILTVATDGGYCAGEEGCNSETTLMSDGKYTVVKPISRKVIETSSVDSKKVQELQKQIEITNFDELRKNKFTEMCPIAYDGFRYVYTFYTAHGKEVIDSCKTAIKENQPLFKLLDSLE